MDTRFPKNLRIVYSCWEHWVPENPYNFPTTWVYFPKDPVKSNCLIPKNAKPCGGKCYLSNVLGNSKKGESVVFKKH